MSGNIRLQILITLAAAACSLAGPASAQVSARRGALPLEGVVTNPDWARKPTGDEMSDLFPAAAQALGIGGAAVMVCRVATSGALENCRIDSETPPGMGFGTAALAMAPYFLMKPMTLDGAPVAGAEVNIPISFTLPNVPASAEPGPSPALPPSPRALALARRILLAQDLAGELRQMMGGVAARSHADESVLERDIDAGLPAYLEQLAVLVATGAGEADLEKVAAFYESPAGRAWTAAERKRRPQQQKALLQLVRDAVLKACAEVECAAAPVTPPAH